MKPNKTIVLLLVVLSAIILQSCAVKRDCRGRVKHKLSNGIWI